MSHADPEANDKFYKWAEKKQGSKELGHAKVHRGKTHDFLGMILDYGVKGKLQVDMKHCIRKMIEEYPHPIKSSK